jgi:glycosidase
LNTLIKKFILLFLILLLLFSGCGGGSSNGNNPDTETGGNSWIVADTAEPGLSPATPRTPGADDWRDEIIYFLMTDRFCDGDGSNNGSFCNSGNINFYHGGDLAGITSHVNYIRSLGATAIWITPVVENVWRNPNYTSYTGYHGYWARDFTKLDSHLGSDTNFYQSFINTMHNNGLLVIQDIVVNHMGPLAAYTNGWTPVYSSFGYTRAWAQILSSGNAGNYNYSKPDKAPFNELSAFHNYGKINNYDDTAQLTQGDAGDLPDLATDSTDVKSALETAYGQWAGYGVDGFRIDTAKHVNKDFWNEFCPAIRSSAASKNFSQFGEVLIGDHPTLANYVDSTSGMDSVLNYDLYYVMRTVFANATDKYHTNATHELTQEITRRSSYSRVSTQDELINFIDNHDNNRFLTDAGGSLDRLWLALTYLMTTKGIPCIYYNTENNVSGDTNTGRKDIPNFKTTGKKTFTLIRVLSKIRKENRALLRGDITVLADSTSGPGIFAFVRYNGTQSENIFVLLNTSGKAITETIDVSNYASAGDTLRNILYAEFSQTETVSFNTNGKIVVSIPAYSMKILKL